MTKKKEAPIKLEPIEINLEDYVDAERDFVALLRHDQLENLHLKMLEILSEQAENNHKGR